MLSAFTTIRRRVSWVLWLPAIIAALSISCDRVPLLAPSGSTITLTSAITALPVNGTADIIAQVIEASGTPPHSGTHVAFLSTLGTLEPAEAETDINGRVQVKFLAGNANGTATITALSGGSTTGTTGALKIAVGTAAVGRVTVSASPASVPSDGGASTITADVFDINGNPLSSAPVSFSTTAGSLSAALVTTNANGRATSVLTTSQTATVTASVGAQPTSAPPPSTGTTTPTTPAPSGQASGSVTVTISAVPILVITPPATAPSAGLPASFTFDVTVAATNGSAVTNVTVNWGDGTSQSLGAVTGKAIVSHVYNNPGTYVVTGRVTDAAGNSSSVSTSVTVIPVPRPTIIITSSPVPAVVNTQTTFNIQITLPSGIGVISTIIFFGDDAVCGCSSQANLGGATTASQPHVYTAVGTYTVTVRVTDTAGQTTDGTTSVSVGP